MVEREKSALYPRTTWDECIDLIQKVGAFNLKSVSSKEIAKKYGLTSTTTKSFVTKINTAKQFGLISMTQGGTVQLTEASKRILYPTGEPIRQLELQCFAQPPMYGKLIAKYDGSALPPLENLANILMNEHRITRSAKDAAAKCFLQSAEQLGLIRGGVLCFSESLEENNAFASTINDLQSAPITPIVEQDKEIKSSASASFMSASITPAVNEADYLSQSIPCENGKVAKIIIPIDATQDDLYLISDMLNVILKRKFKLKTDE